MDLQIKGRVFIVTGGTKGIGLAVVQCLIDEGAKVAVCARSKDDLEKLKELAPADMLIVRQTDVLHTEAMKRFVQQVAEEFGRLDGVVANAGTGTGVGILDATQEEWTGQFSVKVFSVTNLVTPAIPFLQQSDAPRIVIMNAVNAYRPEPSMPVVSAARAAVANLAQSLASELAPFGICVNTIALGAVETERQHDRYRKSRSGLDYESWRKEEAARRRIALGRFGKPEEVAPFVALCLSPLSSYVTGAAISISGGAG